MCEKRAPEEAPLLPKGLRNRSCRILGAAPHSLEWESYFLHDQVHGCIACIHVASRLQLICTAIWQEQAEAETAKTIQELFKEVQGGPAGSW